MGRPVAGRTTSVVEVRGTERLDSLQRRRSWIAVPLAVVYKFFDDQGVYLAAIVTHYAFVAIFPLLLISSSVLGFLLSGNPELAQSLLSSAVAQFPIVGTQLSSPNGLQGSFSAVVVGLLASTYGVLGLGQAVQNALWVGWATPRNSRPNPFLSRVRSAALIAGFGAFTILVTISSLTAQSVSAAYESASLWIGLASTLWSILLITLAVAGLFRISAPRLVSWRYGLSGGAVVGVGFWLLQQLGGYYVQRILRQVTDVNAVFALTLGLTGLLFLAANIFVLGTETTVVLARQLHPRALLTPFTDDVDLTDADRRSYAYYARMQRHKGFQVIGVEFQDVDEDGLPQGPGVDEPGGPPTLPGMPTPGP